MSSSLLPFPSKPRVFILSDISNEPDDAESLVRYLLYSNQFYTEGLVAVTSNWMKSKVCPQDMLKIIDGYEKVVDNLNVHVHPESPYPPAAYFRSILRRGHQVYGIEAIGDDVPLSEGAELLCQRITADSDNPLWVLCWGGTNVLAEALSALSKERSDMANLCERIRVYAISDQDDSSMWIRHHFPAIMYISSIHGWNQYGLATWTGISGEGYFDFDEGGPDSTKVTKDWIKDNIQLGALGTAYPDPMFICEGDTPSFLYLVQNGLGVPEHPEYGSWGGRYVLTNPSPKGVWCKHYGDTADCVVGCDGRNFKSGQATIWRWRDAFQNDFAARIQWSLNPNFVDAHHHPVISLNGSSGIDVMHVEQEAGSSFIMDASATVDPDATDSSNAILTFHWYQYREPSATIWSKDDHVAGLEIETLDERHSVVRVQIPPAETSCVELMSQKAVSRGVPLHLVLEVRKSVNMPLTSYRRIIIHPTNQYLRGGGKGGDAIWEVLKAYQ